MSIRFSALEIGSGDAFLLEKPNWKCLFDAGGSRNRIISLLIKKKKIKRLNLAICSHNDIDHTNGFIGLLKSDVEIDEIWLPGTWASVLKYVKEKGIWKEEIEWLAKVESKFFGKAYEGSIFLIDEDGIFAKMNNEKINIFETESFETESEESIDDFNDSLNVFLELIESKINGFNKELFYGLYDIYYWFRYKQGKGANHPSLLLAIDKIITIAGLAYEKGCKIRWFNPMGVFAPKKMNNGFMALNSSEKLRVQKPRNALAFSLLCLLTTENIYSMVFEYYDKNTPIIRFSADSDCYSQSISPYKENIIVTAPHHGSEANANVYQQLNGENIIWVRSDRKSKKRPCQEFKNQQKSIVLLAIDIILFQKYALNMILRAKNGNTSKENNADVNNYSPF